MPRGERQGLRSGNAMCATPGASFASSINSSITDLDLARIAAQAASSSVVAPGALPDEGTSRVRGGIGQFLAKGCPVCRRTCLSPAMWLMVMA